jgi:hypothetical protein
MSRSRTITWEDPIATAMSCAVHTTLAAGER